MDQVTLSKEQTQVLLMLSGQQNQLIAEMEQLQAAYAAQLEMLKAVYKIEGKVQVVPEGNQLVLKAIEEGEDVPPPA